MGKAKGRAEAGEARAYIGQNRGGSLSQRSFTIIIMIVAMVAVSRRELRLQLQLQLKCERRGHHRRRQTLLDGASNNTSTVPPGLTRSSPHQHPWRASTVIRPAIQHTGQCRTQHTASTPYVQ